MRTITQHPPPSQQTERPLVGRDAVLEDVSHALDLAAAAGSGAVLVRGEAGIGKSEILMRAVDVAYGRGWSVLRLRPDELSRAIPYSSLGHAVAELRESGDDEADRRAVMLVEILDLAANSAVPSIYGAAAGLLDTLRASRQVVIVVDDLPLVDDDTLVLIAGLMRRSAPNPLMLLASMRRPDVAPSGALRTFLERLTADDSLTCIDLGPLDDQTVALLVTEVLGRQADDEIVELVRAQNGGNPFFAIQTVMELLEVGALEEGDGRVQLASRQPPISSDRRSALLDRIMRIGPDARRMGRALALVDQVSIDRLPLAAQLAAITTTDADAIFDALVESGVIHHGDDGSYGFCHGFVRDALYHEIGPAERWRWHRQTAEWLTLLPTSPAVELELARHVMETAEHGDETAIRRLAGAAELACSSAPPSSLPIYRRAIAITPASHPQFWQLHAHFAVALYLAGRPREAARCGREALPHTVGTARERLASLIVEALGEASTPEAALAFIAREREAGTSSARLDAQVAYLHALIGDVEAADIEAADVLARLDACSAEDRAAVLVHLVQLHSLTANQQALLQASDELRTSIECAPSASRLSAHANLCWVLAVRGDTKACTSEIGMTEQWLGDSPSSPYRTKVLVARALNAANTGDWDSTLAVNDELARELDAAGSVSSLAVLRAVSAEILANRGEWTAAHRLLDLDVSEEQTLAAMTEAAYAEIELLSGNAHAARTRLTASLGKLKVPPLARDSLLSRLADVEVATGNPGAVSGIVAEIDRDGHCSPRPDFGRALLSLGRATGDHGMLREAAAIADEHDLALLRGRARLDLGLTGTETERNLTEAVEIFHALGATPWRRKAAAELRSRGMRIPRHRAAGSPSQLTETELQIARLVQVGRQNREIARTVVLSVKTVEAYLSRIYAKTGCTSRLELARALDSQIV